ncbi:MAG: hypothetical protein IJK46_06540 [Prevotella sp.]|nr:hypothetical protein [Prevotella sp.]
MHIASSLTPDGTFIVHPDEKRILNGNFYESLRQQPDSVAHNLAREMGKGKRGVIKTAIEGVTSYVFYAPLEHTGWTVAIIVPQLKIVIPSIFFLHTDCRVHLPWPCGHLLFMPLHHPQVNTSSTRFVQVGRRSGQG